jgi:hypothetical protein
MHDEADLWIRLADGRDVCEHFSRPDIAWQIRHRMLDSISHGEPIECIQGEIPARDVKRIDFIASEP